MESDYSEVLKHMNDTAAFEGEYEFLASHMAECGLDGAGSCLSIGSGDGHFESQCKEHRILSNIERYIAVEPEEEVLKSLKQCMLAKYPNIKCNFYCCGAEEFEGPDEPVDVILVMRMLNYIPDKVALFKRLMSYLTPQGKIIIIHNQTGNIYHHFWKLFHIKLRSYFSENIKHDLQRAGFLTHQEYSINDVLDISNPSIDLARTFFLRDPTDQELNDFITLMKDHSLDTAGQLAPMTQSVFIIPNQTREKVQEDF